MSSPEQPSHLELDPYAWGKKLDEWDGTSAAEDFWNEFLPAEDEAAVRSLSRRLTVVPSAENLREDVAELFGGEQLLADFESELAAAETVDSQFALLFRLSPQQRVGIHELSIRKLYVTRERQ